jgi:hypothetical protein
VGWGGAIDTRVGDNTTELVKSSKRLERLTKILIGVTAVLAILTAVLIARTV